MESILNVFEDQGRKPGLRDKLEEIGFVGELEKLQASGNKKVPFPHILIIDDYIMNTFIAYFDQQTFIEQNFSL